MSKLAELILYERCRDLSTENTTLKAQVQNLIARLQQSLADNRDLAATNEDSFRRHQQVFQDFCTLQTKLDAFLKTHNDTDEEST